MSKKYKYLIWDLDGTITDSYQGVAEALDILFERKGMSIDKSTYHEYIGPPLRTSFAPHFQTPEAMEEALQIFREFYNVEGIYHAMLYEGIEGVFQELKQRGYVMFIATSKRENVAIEVVKSFGVYQYFERVFGADDTIGIVEKEDVLANLFRNYPDIDRNECIMIGDTIYDMLGAKMSRIDYLAALYGFGDNEDVLMGATMSVNKVIEYLDVF